MMLRCLLLCIIVGWLGRALMQFETCQSWIAELVPHFGSSSAIWVVNFFGMPPLAFPDLVEWSLRARRWRVANPGADALQISEEQRKQDGDAKAAYFWEARRGLPRDWPHCGPCCSCGQPSYSWCEGCYGRVPETSPFGIVCQTCDTLHEVCDLCRAGGVDWQVGHQRYLDAHHGADEEETFEVTAIDGEACTTTRISFQELSASTGRSVEQLKAEIRARIRDP